MSVKGLFVGLSTIDSHFLVDRFPSSNSKTRALDFSIYCGGPATNAAITFSHLGGESHLITSIGNHSFGQFIKNELNHFNIITTDITPDTEISPTQSGIITTKKNGNRAVFYYIPKNIIVKKDILKSINISDYNFVLVDGFFIDHSIYISKLSKEYNIPVVLDGGSWKEKTEDLLDNINIAICSQNFAPPGKKLSRKIFQFLLNKNIKKIAITRGHKPILICDQNKYYKHPIKKINAIDTLGAGDIFHGAFCYYYALSENFYGSIKKASDVAEKSCLSFGTRKWMEK